LEVGVARQAGPRQPSCTNEKAVGRQPTLVAGRPRPDEATMEVMKRTLEGRHGVGGRGVTTSGEGVRAICTTAVSGGW